MSRVVSQLDESAKRLKELCPDFPKQVVVLGSGLAKILDQVEIEQEITLSDLPHVAPLTVEGHVSRLIVANWKGTRIACMQGRLHFYEGYSMEQVVFPLRLFAWAGAEVFYLTNASGGLHADMTPRDLVLITDHINLTGTNPLIGPNENELGPRFPDMSFLYDPELRGILKKNAERLGVKLREGVYVGTHGPSYETPAEIRMYRTLGADVVGMSTVPEAIALNHMGKRVVGVSCVTNLAAGVTTQPLVHDEVLEVAKQGHPDFANLILETAAEVGGAL